MTFKYLPEGRTRAQVTTQALTMVNSIQSFNIKMLDLFGESEEAKLITAQQQLIGNLAEVIRYLDVSEKITFEVSDYKHLKQLIIDSVMPPTYRPIKAWMKQENIGTSDKNRQEITMDYLDKMHKEGVLKINPENDGTGIQKAKYILTK